MADNLTIPFADTSAADLTFSLRQGRLPAVCGTTVSLSPGTRVELNVLGCSHQVILVENETDHLTETLACLPGLPASLPGSVATETASTQHEFESRTEHHSGADFGRAVQRITEDAQNHQHNVVARFPGHPGAVTAIVLDSASADELRWSTWHCYPQHGEIVLTSSRVHGLQSQNLTVHESAEVMA